jgi:hypothetical protein
VLDLANFKFPEILDNTIVSTWNVCAAKCVQGHFLHLKPKGPQVHLDAGALYAKAMEIYRLAFYTKEHPLYHDHVGCLTIAMRHMLTSFGYDEDIEAYYATTKKPFHRIAELFVKYFDRFGHLSDPVKPAIINDILMVERSFTLELDLKNPDTGEPILYHGRYDMLADYHGGLFVYDDKTCSQLGKTWGNKWDTRSQFTGYCFGARAHGHKVIGAIVRGGCFYVNKVDYAESISYRKDWELDKWWEDLHHSTHNMLQWYSMMKDAIASGKVTQPIQLASVVQKNGYFNEACQAYAGCEYLQLCQAQFPQRWLGDYTVRVWDPRNPDREEN